MKSTTYVPEVLNLRGDDGNGHAGTTGLAADLTFTTNVFYRRFSDDPTPTAAALALPNMQGGGLVRDLRAAGEALRER